jgi:hypothetical protein
MGAASRTENALSAKTASTDHNARDPAPTTAKEAVTALANAKPAERANGETSARSLAMMAA